MKRSPHDRAAWTILAALSLALVQWWPAFRRLHLTGFGDWQAVLHNWEAARVSLLRHGEWPLWDPYHCGGVTILGNPESQLYSPLFLLALPLGSVIALKLFLLLHIAAALLGVYVLGRADYDLPPIPAAFAAVTWGLCGCFAWDGGGGHGTFLPFAFAPWLLLCFERARDSLGYVVACALLVTLALYEGGTYPVPYFAVLLSFEILRRLLVRPARGQVLVSAAIIGALVALCGAIRLVPIALSLGELPRVVKSPDALFAGELLEMLVARSHGWRFEPHPYVWPEYGSYVGVAAVALGLLGLLATLGRGRRHLLAGLLLFGLLTAGNHGAPFPWTLLHELPVFDSLRVPSRFAILLTLYLSLIAGHGAALLLARLPDHRIVTLLALAGLVAHTADLIDAGRPMARFFRDPPLSDAPPAERFHQVEVSGLEYPAQFASFPRRNVGTGACYVGAMRWQVSPHIWHGDAPQARLSRGSRGSRGSPSRAEQLVSVERTPHHVTLDVKLDEAATVVINQNFAPGFRTTAGKLVEDRGRLAVALPPGDRRVVVSYRPPWLWPSALVSCIGLLLCALLAWRARPRPAATPPRP